MSIPTLKDLEPAFQKADQRIKDYIMSDSLDQAFEALITKHKLHLDEAGQISRALNAVFLKVRPSSEFQNLLKEALEQNGGAYDAVLSDINETVFKEYRKHLAEETGGPAPKPTPTSASSEVPQAPPIQPIERKTNESALNVSVDTLKEEVEQNSAPVYKGGTDPYREPIE